MELGEGWFKTGESAFHTAQRGHLRGWMGQVALHGQDWQVCEQILQAGTGLSHLPHGLGVTEGTRTWDYGKADVFPQAVLPSPGRDGPAGPLSCPPTKP